MVSGYSKCGSKMIFVAYLLNWWEDNKRDFPWRHTRDPYAVLVAEALLRKTTAQQAQKLYSIFIKKYPNPRRLSNANRDELDDLLRPLGMEHKRAEQLIMFGKTIVEKHNGRIPDTEAELLRLPGIGQYATNALLSFSHYHAVATVDTNFIRVLGRVFNLRSSKARARNDVRVWEFARALVPEAGSREFNLAVLDFAATVCKARKPQCDICPVSAVCHTFRKSCLKASPGIPTESPAKGKEG